MKRKLLLLCILLLTACGGKMPAPSPTASPLPTLLPIASPTDQVIASATPYIISPDQTIYADGNFVIREIFLGKVDTWSFEGVIMPGTRIENAEKDLGLGRDMACGLQLPGEYHCSQTIEIPLANGQTNVFTFISEYLTGNGRSAIVKNGITIWEGHMNGGTWFPIGSSHKFGDELIFNYIDSNWGEKNNTKLWLTKFIVRTSGNEAIVVQNAFAPNVINGNLIYFGEEEGKTSIVFNGKRVGNEYENILDQYCCWDVPRIQIACDGERIDFFAQRNGGWYHIQAGYFSNK
jgi:hypothetical protein